MRTQKMVDRAARDEERQQVLGKDEWCRRCAVRIQQRAGIEKYDAEMVAGCCWDDVERVRKNAPKDGQRDPEAWADQVTEEWGE